MSSNVIALICSEVGPNFIIIHPFISALHRPIVLDLFVLNFSQYCRILLKPANIIQNQIYMANSLELPKILSG